ncbi:hypothetical protein [Luteimonas sp. MHLX1A]|uniref:hypothetical protein n=1 Tax=Alterluteimonas muca TaxID=2878684 RepID=UPI001E58A88B|nr:hypothetical protein [Luteimonas sp. MHLX1A]MCD9046848.1 hypothetical protein [Luteimonas sp. MHLX1A]
MAAIGLPEVPSVLEIRQLLELGIAAKKAGFLCARGKDNQLTLVQSVAADPTPRLTAPAAMQPVTAHALHETPLPASATQAPATHAVTQCDTDHDSQPAALQTDEELPISRVDAMPSASLGTNQGSEGADVDELEEGAGDTQLFDGRTRDLLRQVMQFDAS